MKVKIITENDKLKAYHLILNDNIKFIALSKYIRNNIKLNSSEALFFYNNSKLIPHNESIELCNLDKDDKNVLTIEYDIEKTFGFNL